MFCILYYDGDPRDREELTRILSADGYEVESVNSATEAIRRVSPRRFGVAIVDLDSKRPSGTLSGLEAISILKKIDPCLLIVAVTDDDSLRMEREARAEGVFYYVVKPIDTEEIQAVVKNAIEGQHERRAWTGEAVKK